MAGRKHLVYEVRSGGSVLAQFSSESKARKELRRFRKEGISVGIRSRWIGSERKRKASEPKDPKERPVLWMKDLPDLLVSMDAASDLVGCWGTIDDPFFLGAYRNGSPCDPGARDSDLSVQPSDEGLRLCYRDIPGRRVFVVVSPIEYVMIADDILVISGRGSDGLPTAVALYIADAEGNAPTRGYPFAEGWYLVSGGFLLFLWRSETRLSDRHVREYDRYVLCTAVYPAFGTYETRERTLPYRDRDGLDRFISENYGSSVFGYIQMDDPIGFRTAIMERDWRDIRPYMAECPQLDILQQCVKGRMRA